MPWREVSLMSLREEFVRLSEGREVSFSELCQRFGISRKTGYKWVGRYRDKGRDGLADGSRRPKRIARKLAAEKEQAIVAVRKRHPSWGARKIRRLLKGQSKKRVAACSTITAVFHRNGLIDPAAAGSRPNWQRFEHAVPNSLWQMDFKGRLPTLAGQAHPLTVLDDHSRFNLCLKALPNEQSTGVQKSLTQTFRHYGLPNTMIMDNGSPWGSDAEHPYTALTVWLIHLGIWVSHSRPYHPQTLGKDERFHGTLKRDLLHSRQWEDLSQLQEALDQFRHQYNFIRPHEALGLEVPASRYEPSLRSFPESLPPIEYEAGLYVRKVQQGGELSFKGRTFRVGKAFCGYSVGVRPTPTDGVFDVMFCQQTISQVDLREP
jgi:transposase InsO family protein